MSSTLYVHGSVLSRAAVTLSAVLFPAYFGNAEHCAGVIATRSLPSRQLECLGMKPKTLYFVLCFAGVLLPYWQFLPWVIQHGLNFALFGRELFANRIGAFFGMDVLVSAVVLLVFSRTEGARLGIRRRWLALVAVLTVGVSLGLPLFLYLRELQMEHKSALS